MSDHSSTDSVELTVEDENRRNSETDDVHSILDNFLGAKEETLEQLVGGFMYLTMEDVRNSSNASGVTTFAAMRTMSMGENPDQPVARAQKTVTVPEHSTNGGGRNSGGQTEDIEEEVLEEWTSGRRTSEDTLFRHRPASLTKFDNFVVSEEDSNNDSERGAESDDDGGEGRNDEEEDWMPTSGYMASFAAGNSTLEEQPQTTENTSHRPDGQTVNKGSSETSTLTSQHTTHMTHSTSDQIHTKELSHGTTHTGEPSQDRAAVSESPEPDHSSFVENGDGVSTDAEELSAESAAITRTPDLDCDSSSQVCDDDVESPAWALNPGEAEEEIDVMPVARNVSVIEVSTKLASCDTASAGGDATSQEAEQECSDEVTPFKLDEDFDYDNVVYTPKFTWAEMNYLTSFLPDKS